MGPVPSSADPAAPPTAPAARTQVSKAQAQEIVDRLAKKIEGLGGRLGASVVASGEGEAAVLGEHEANKAMNPASNAKLPTAAAALSILGSDHRFSTVLLGKVDGGRVEELAIRGRGDPSLTTADLRDLARQLKVAGASEIGRIVVDQSYFEGSYVPPAFEQQPDEWAPFRAPTAAVSVDRNTVTVWVRPAEEAKKGAAVITDPPLFAKVSGSVKTGSKDSAERVAVTLTPDGDHLAAKVSGSVPLGSKPVPVVRRVDDPRALAGYALRAVLLEQGFKVEGEIAVRAAKSNNVLALHTSDLLGEIVPRLGKESDNFTAEMLFIAIGASKKGPASASSGADAVTAYLTELGALDSGAVVKNGSGLFDANRISARGLTKLLHAAARDSAIAPEFVGQLAIAGVDGTLRSRMKKWGKSRAIRAKTGTLADVVALSGYILDARGEPAIAFSFMTSGVKGKTADARDAIDQAVVALADELRK